MNAVERALRDFVAVQQDLVDLANVADDREWQRTGRSRLQKLRTPPATTTYPHT